MIDDLKAYPQYKDSGLPWLGMVPSHWQQRRMKFLFKERVQKGFPDEPLLAATQSKGVVRKEDAYRDGNEGLAPPQACREWRFCH
jgi:type I restriction enzyme S subunit